MIARPIALLALIGGLLWAGEAAAQFSQYVFPVEEAHLEQHVQLQLGYGRDRRALSLVDPPVTSEFTRHQLVFSAKGQIIVGERTELAVNVPFVQSSFETAAEVPQADALLKDSKRFGDIITALKVRLLGGEERLLSVVSYLDIALPTHSGARPRAYVTLRGGGAAEVNLGALTAGGGLDGIWTVSGIEGASEDQAYVGISAFGRYALLGLLRLNLALQLYNSVHPSSDQNVFAVTPGVELDLPLGFEAGLALRIGTTDEAAALLGGRVAVLAHGGWGW